MVMNLFRKFIPTNIQVGGFISRLVDLYPGWWIFFGLKLAAYFGCSAGAGVQKTRQSLQWVAAKVVMSS